MIYGLFVPYIYLVYSNFLTFDCFNMETVFGMVKLIAVTTEHHSSTNLWYYYSQCQGLFIVYRMDRLYGEAHEISGIKAPIFLYGWVQGGWWWGGWYWVG